MQRLLVTVCLFLVGAPVLAQMSPVGLWRSVDDHSGKSTAEIRITTDAQGLLSGVVEKALAPNDEPNCDLCTDERKGQPKLGMQIIRGAKKVDGAQRWEGGKILDPDNGKEYSLRQTPLDGGQRLEVRGYIAFFYRNQIWIRAQ